MENTVFGPVPSRRLGRSLGINNIPHKVCTYSCMYCQVGKTKKNQAERRVHYSPDVLVQQVGEKLSCLGNSNTPQYISIVPDGEPTLDVNLGELILKLRTFGIPVAVITNGSTLNRMDVREELRLADYVSVKMDTVTNPTWRKINKPHSALNLKSILNGIVGFSKEFKGKLVTESMLIQGLNDSGEELVSMAQFLQTVQPRVAYIAIPARPPAFENTLPADERAVTLAYEIFTACGLSAELLTGYEGNAFASSGNFAEDLLSITAVHPMREEAVMELMSNSGATAGDLQELIENKLIRKIKYNNREYYLRKFTDLKN